MAVPLAAEVVAGGGISHGDVRGLELIGLTKRFGEILALDGLSLEIRPGRVLGFLGPNGAGKTTAMR